METFRPAGIPSVISAPGDFHGMISMECARADRYQSHFSLALFEVGTSSENSVLICRLVRTLHNRFRNTEKIGWYSRRQIGIIMPLTPGEGRVHVAALHHSFSDAAGKQKQGPHEINTDLL